MKITVRDGNINQALRVLKRKLQTEGVLRELRMREFYEKPSTKRRREKNESIRRREREERKRAAAGGY